MFAMEWRNDSRSVPSLASGSDCPVVIARGERSRSRRHDLGRMGQPTRFLGLGNTGKPNNSAILSEGRVCGKRVLSPFAGLRSHHSLLFDSCVLMSPESTTHGPRQLSVQGLSFSARADVPHAPKWPYKACRFR